MQILTECRGVDGLLPWIQSNSVVLAPQILSMCEHGRELATIGRNLYQIALSITVLIQPIPDRLQNKDGDEYI